MTSFKQKTAPAAGPEPRANEWQLWGLCLAAATVPLAWSTHFVGEYTLPKFFMLQLGLLAALLGAATEAPLAGTSALDAAVGLNLAVLVASTLFSQDWRVSVLGRYNSYSHGLWTSALYAAACLGASRLDRPSARRLAAVLLATGGLVAAYGVSQIWGFEPFLRAPLPEGRAVSSLGSPVDLGAYLALLAPLAAAWAASRRRLSGMLAGAALTAVLLACSWYTASRGAWLGAAVGVAVAAVLLFWRFPLSREASSKPPVARRSPALALAFAALVLTVGGWLIVRRTIHRNTPSDTSRYEVWRTAWYVFESRPLLGTGPDTFEQAFRKMRTPEFVRRMEASTRHQAYAHNDFLQALATTGLAGFAAYLYLLWATLAAGRRALCEKDEDRWLAAGLLGGLVGVFCNVKFNPVALEVMTTASLMIGLLAALARGERAPAPRAREFSERGVALAGALASALGLVLAARWLGADVESKYAQVEFKRGQIASAFDHARAAITIDRCEAAYHVQAMNHMGEMINLDKTVQGRMNLLNEALGIGQTSVACHPMEINAHYVLGIAAWIHVQLGFEQQLPLAEKEIDAALELDPLFQPLIEQRLAIAAKRGPAAAAPWIQRLKESKALASM